MIQTLQGGVGLDIVVQLAVEGDLAAPEIPVVRLDLEELVDVADGAGIVLQVVLHVDQETLGLDLVVVALYGTGQVVARFVHVPDDIIIVAVEVAQVGIVRNDLQTGVDLTLGGVPGVRIHVPLGPADITGHGRLQSLRMDDFCGRQGKKYSKTG